MSREIIPNSFQTPNVHVDTAMEFLSCEEYKCLSFATRHILGWPDDGDHDTAKISVTMFEHGYTTKNGTHYGGTGLSRAAILKAVNALCDYCLMCRFAETADGRIYGLGQSPNWQGLQDRQQEQLEAARRRTANARQQRAGKSDIPVSATNHLAVSPTNHLRSVPLTSAGKSDILNQSHIQSHIQSQLKAAAEPPPTTPNVFSLYERNIGVLTPLIADELKDLLKDYPPEWVEDGIKETALSGGRSPKYIRRVLERWQLEGKSTGRPKAPANGNGLSRASPTPPPRQTRDPALNGFDARQMVAEMERAGQNDKGWNPFASEEGAENDARSSSDHTQSAQTS